MPLPVEGTAWPPEPWGAAYSVYEENDAWYTGDRDRIAAASQRSMRAPRMTHRHRGQEYEGGIVGALSTSFWGRPIPAGESRMRLHAGAPADISMLSSDLLFAEPPRFELPDGSGGENAQARLEEIMSGELARSTYLQGAELASAQGAVAFTVAWDKDVHDSVWLREAAADTIIPEFRSGFMVAINLWSEVTEGHVFWRFIERHEPGRIVYALYKGSENSIGKRRKLQEHPMSEPYAVMVGDGDFVVTGTNRLTAGLMVNLPARDWRKRPLLQHMGRSDYGGGIKGLFDAFDSAWSSWMRDIDLGRARLVVPASYLQSNGPGNGASFDVDREIFSPINMPGLVSGEMAMQEVQFDIRYEEHEATCNALYQRILARTGLADPDDSDRDTTQTATGVLDETRAKERTRDKKGLNATTTLAQLAAVALEVDGIQFPGKGGGVFDRPSVTFPDWSQEDPEKRSRVIAQLRAATVMSTETGVRLSQPDLSEKEVGIEVQKIIDEKGVPAPDPALLNRTDPTKAALAAAADKLRAATE